MLWWSRKSLVLVWIQSVSALTARESSLHRHLQLNKIQQTLQPVSWYQYATSIQYVWVAETDSQASCKQQWTTNLPSCQDSRCTCPWGWSDKWILPHSYQHGIFNNAVCHRSSNQAHFYALQLQGVLNSCWERGHMDPSVSQFHL